MNQCICHVIDEEKVRTYEIETKARKRGARTR